MNQELPPGQEADEIQGLVQIVANSLAEGKEPQAISQQLIDSGWDPQEANALVGSIQQQLHQERSSSQGSESRGWLIWIGAIVGINFLSWVFNWGFWIY